MKTFVFDADGVVCIGQSFSTALEQQYQIPPARLAAFFAGPFTDCLLGRRDLKEEIGLHALGWGWRGSADDLLAFWFQQEHVVCPGILACVRRLRAKGHVCALGTNQEPYRAAYLRTTMRLAQEFDPIFPSCELGAAKPSGLFFQRIQERLALPPEELCLIDDCAKNVAAAKTAGWSAIWYRGTADILAIEEAANQSITDNSGAAPLRV